MKTNKQLFAIVAVATMTLFVSACANIPVSGMTGGEALSVQLSIPATTTPDVSIDGPKLVNPIGLYFYENGQWGKKVEVVGGRYETEIGRTYRFTARVQRSHKLAKVYGFVEWRRGDQTLHRFPSKSNDVTVTNDDLSYPHVPAWMGWTPTHRSDPSVYATLTIQVEDEKGQTSDIAVLTPVVVVEPKVPPPAVPPAISQAP